jgi:integrase
VRNAWVLLSSILEKAVVYGYLSNNPTRGVTFPQKGLKEKPALIAGEPFDRMLKNLNEPHQTIVRLIAATGLRISELLALRWRAIDLEIGTLAVRESVFEGEFQLGLQDDAFVDARIHRQRRRFQDQHAVSVVVAVVLLKHPEGLTFCARAVTTSSRSARSARWVKYRRAGKTYYESSDSTRKGDAIDLLRRRDGKIAEGAPITPKIGRLTFNEAAGDLLNDYRVNGKRSLVVVERRVNKHLAPYFEGHKMANITTVDVCAYIAHRQQQGVVHHKTGQRIGDVSNAEINRERRCLDGCSRWQYRPGWS